MRLSKCLGEEVQIPGVELCESIQKTLARSVRVRPLLSEQWLAPVKSSREFSSTHVNALSLLLLLWNTHFKFCLKYFYAKWFPHSVLVLFEWMLYLDLKNQLPLRGVVQWHSPERRADPLRLAFQHEPMIQFLVGFIPLQPLSHAFQKIPFISIKHKLLPQYGFKIGGACPPGFLSGSELGSAVLRAGGLPQWKQALGWKGVFCSPAWLLGRSRDLWLCC